MNHSPRITHFAALAVFWLCSCLSLRAAFTVSNRQILNNGQPFTIKGVCYNPTPIGDSGSRSPNGDYFTSGYSALWDRDLPQLRAMGANVIRVYGWSPTADHSAFLNRCYNGGDHPLYVLVNYWVDPSSDWTNAKTVKGITTNFTNIETRLGNNPAVLGLIIGNEVNSQNSNGYNAAFWSAMNSVATVVKQTNSNRLVTLAITDALDQVAANDASMTAIDFWCMQIYRGTGFGTFFSDFAARSSRPVVISEYGFDSFNHGANAAYGDNAAYPAAVLASLWREIASAQSICAGGCVFEYCDEWFRAPGGTETTQDAGGWYASGFPDRYADEEWFGLFSIAKNGTSPNLLTAKEAFYEFAAMWNPVPTPPVTTASSTFADPGFESVRTGTDNFYAFIYTPAITGWTFTGYAGITGNSSGFTSGNTGAPDGTQVAFVQMSGAISTQFSLTAGSYRISAQTANRGNWGGQQTVVVAVDGNEVGRFAGGATYSLSTTNVFTVTAGVHTIQFSGLATGDATLFLDSLSIQPAPASIFLGNASFEVQDVGANAYLSFAYTPATVAGSQDWTFSGAAGLTGNGSGFTSGNPDAPLGKQVAFVQTSDGVISQALSIASSGNYQVSASAAQRGNWNMSRQVVSVYVDDTLVGTIAPSGKNYEKVVLPALNLASGNHVLKFKGTAADDSTVFLDDVSITVAP